MMKPQFDLRNAPLSANSLSGLSLNPLLDAKASSSARGRFGITAVMGLGLLFAGVSAFSQEPTPIPNWNSGQAGTSAGQYAPNQNPQQPQYQQPQYQQPQYQQQAPQQPSYQPPPDGQQYGQPQYQQPQPQGYQQGYGQAIADPDQGGAAPYDGGAPYQLSRALSPDQLERMLAPIALYPDNLVSMVLAASTYP